VRASDQYGLAPTCQRVIRVDHVKWAVGASLVIELSRLGGVD
jgi:hypothetical protein